MIAKSNTNKKEIHTYLYCDTATGWHTFRVSPYSFAPPDFSGFAITKCLKKLTIF